MKKLNDNTKYYGPTITEEMWDTITEGFNSQDLFDAIFKNCKHLPEFQNIVYDFWTNYESYDIEQ